MAKVNPFFSSNSESTATDHALQQLLTIDQSELLDIIDKLGEYGISGDIGLPFPQLVVCGDQSSGKSSVLEAISGRSFPKGGNVCTTFATQLALRRSVKPSVEIRIIPSSSRSEQEAKRLAAFKPSSNDIGNFQTIVQNAKEFLHSQIQAKEDSYFRDVLHVTISEPSLPPLTLVDLPGIIHSAGSRQTDKDVSEVRKLVQAYIEDQNSIILAVLSAENDIENQAILGMVKRVDPTGQRTLGIITKPDTLISGQKREAAYMKCARNQEHEFELGWHIVKNLGPGQEGATLEDREKAEIEYFAGGLWRNVVESEQLGIGQLRLRLSKLLEERTRPALPNVVARIRNSLQECQLQLDRLGPARINSNEQRVFLSNLSQKFQRISEQAFHGRYHDDAFFRHGVTDDDPRRLCAVINGLNRSFAIIVKQRGHSRCFYDSEREQNQILAERAFVGDKFPEKFTVTPPELVFRSDFIDTIDQMSRQNSGREPPGLPNHNIISALFQEHSERWMLIALEHLENVRDATQEHLDLIATYVATKETASALKRHLIAGEMERRHAKAIALLQQIMAPYKRSFIVCQDETFLADIQSLNPTDSQNTSSNPIESEADVDSTVNERQSPENVYSHLGERAARTGPLTSSSEFMLKYMLAYYKVSLRFSPKRVLICSLNIGCNAHICRQCCQSGGRAMYSRWNHRYYQPNNGIANG
jgi:GTPase SAR1 family protein